MIQTVTMYRLVCDFPDCEVSAQDGSDYYAWASRDGATVEAQDSDWLHDDDEHWFCDGHPTSWASDFEGETAGTWERTGDEEFPRLLLNDFGIGDGEALLIADVDALTAALDRLAAVTA